MKNSTKKTQAVNAGKQEDADIKLVSAILLDACENRASDIHIEWVAGKMRVRLRVDGCLRESNVPIPAEMQNQVITRLKIMADLNEKEARLPQDGRILIKVKDKDYDLRVSVVPYTTGESFVIRILSRQTVVLELDRIGFTQSNLEKLRHWIKRPNGLIIAGGVTGSGKTTLLYCILQTLNSPEVKITTVEDPVEYIIEGVNQQMVNVNAGVTFARALRCQLRQDPDIMLVGEIRDLETVQIEIQAALTGHLVLTTLHTPGAPETIRRLLDIGVEPFLVNNTLIGTVNQMLVRKICEHCKEEYKPEDWVMDFLGPHKPKQFFRGKGCAKCHNFGYRGRTAIHEMLELDDPLRKLIAKDAGAEELRQQALTSGMISMKADGLAKASQGITTVEEVLRTCVV